ncbi:unnamed protein product [Effrenium voratum]|nr:unnamed protein product [Effrenium voratum]
MRKIIKKFDKRFHCRFQEVIGLPDTAQQLVTAEDISVRLLKPAHECLRQIRSYRPSTINQVERPLLQLRQFTFWVRELQNGIELLGVHIGGTGEDLSTCVKNTFIDVSEHESPLRRSRAKSWDCTRVQVACPGDVPPSSDEDGQEGPSDSKPKNCSGSERRSEPRRAKEHSGSQKWWGELSDNCAISGFPIAHLPYPPFKLQMGKGKGHKFVDGQFLMLQILSSFNFESLGRPLTQAEVQALDQHIKKCKLSPLRVSRGLELLCLVSQGNLRARQEMAELRAKAAKKLGALKHIQRARLQRGDCQAIPALPGKLEARRPAKSK